jgi:hypothetical protein
LYFNHKLDLSAAWDLFMDFSLLQQGAKNHGLRDILAFGSQKWMYYSIMVLDPILRFSWIFLAIFARNIQHGSIVAFVVAFVEVTRRGMWTLFRVENEHCTNISQEKASRDMPLPYKIEDEPVDSGEALSAILDRYYEIVDIVERHDSSSIGNLRPHIGHSTPLIESGYSGSDRYYASVNPAAQGLLRGLSRRLANAHAEDFQRKKRPSILVNTDETRGFDQALQGDERANDGDALNHTIPKEQSDVYNHGGIVETSLIAANRRNQ